MGFPKILATDAQTGQHGQSIETQYRQDVAGLEDQPSDVFVRNGAGQYMRHLHYGYEIVNPAEPYWVTATEFVETTGVEDKVFEHASSLSNPAYVRTTGYSYDDVNGLLTSMTEPFDETERIPRTTITSYDDTFHAYPKVITDAKGFTTQRTYTAEGELATFIDQNNEITRYEYDGFGRKKKE